LQSGLSTLSAAARASGLSQPTLSRHIAALEHSLKLTLFDRTSQGLTLAPSGRELLEHANTMLEAANRFSLHAEGQTQAIDGTVRITASEVVATYLLPDLITSLQRDEPQIQIEILASDQSGNLLQREADIALRMYQPTQQDVITKKLGHLDLGMYASHDYVKRYGEPQALSDFAEHTLIGEDSNSQIIDGFSKHGVRLARADFGVRCDNQVVAWEMCKAGCGIGFMQKFIGDNCAAVTALLGGAVVGQLPVWLTAHAELRTSRRIARVFEYLGDGFRVDPPKPWKKNLPGICRNNVNRVVAQTSRTTLPMATTYSNSTLL